MDSTALSAKHFLINTNVLLRHKSCTTFCDFRQLQQSKTGQNTLETVEDRLGKENRAGLGALRTRPLLAKGKFFTSSVALSAKLFTAGAADEEGLTVALLPRQ